METMITKIHGFPENVNPLFWRNDTSAVRARKRGLRGHSKYLPNMDGCSRDVHIIRSGANDWHIVRGMLGVVCVVIVHNVLADAITSCKQKGKEIFG